METETREIIDPLLAKALAHPLRVRLLTILNERVASPTQLSRELDEPLGNVSYHVKVLVDHRCIELVRKESYRGAVQHFYRAIKRPFFSDPEWLALPSSTQNAMSAWVVELLHRDAARALATGTLQESDDPHLSRTPMVVDQRGWEDVAALLSDALDRVLEIQAESAGRLTEAHAEGFNTRVGLMHFRLASSAEAEQGSAPPATETVADGGDGP